MLEDKPDNFKSTLIFKDMFNSLKQDIQLTMKTPQEFLEEKLPRLVFSSGYLVVTVHESNQMYQFNLNYNMANILVNLAVKNAQIEELQADCTPLGG